MKLISTAATIDCRLNTSHKDELFVSSRKENLINCHKCHENRVHYLSFVLV